VATLWGMPMKRKHVLDRQRALSEGQFAAGSVACRCACSALDVGNGACARRPMWHRFGGIGRPLGDNRPTFRMRPGALQPAAGAWASSASLLPVKGESHLV
jgi:hypothetical protein